MPQAGRRITGTRGGVLPPGGSAMSSGDLSGVLFMGIVVGLPVLGWVATSVAGEWRKARVAEQHAALKQQMIEKGFSAGEIVRVIEARPNPKPGDADKA